MKLLVFSPYYPPHIGGLQSHAQQFNKHLSKTGANITVFTSQLPTTAPLNETVNNIKIIRFPALEIIPNYPIPKFWQTTFWKQWQQLKNQNYDIVISRTRFFSTSLLTLVYAKSNRTPWLHIEHGSDFVSLSNPITNFLAHFYDYTLGRLVLRLAIKVVANSKASANFVKRLSGRNAHVVYRGVEKETITKIKSSNLTTDYRLQTTGLTIITYLGRLIDGKGVDDLLRALEKLKTKDYNLKTNSYHCLIIGDGPRKKSLLELAKRLSISKHVSFLGQQSFYQSMSILKASDIFVNPSHTEGLPTSVIEAALCKTTIIATNVGGTPEIVTNETSGYLIKPKQPNILADKLKHLINNPDQRLLFSENAYHEVINKFSWAKSTAAYNELLKQMLKS